MIPTAAIVLFVVAILSIVVMFVGGILLLRQHDRVRESMEEVNNSAAKLNEKLRDLAEQLENPKKFFQ